MSVATLTGRDNTVILVSCTKIFAELAAGKIFHDQIRKYLGLIVLLFSGNIDTRVWLHEYQAINILMRQTHSVEECQNIINSINILHLAT